MASFASTLPHHFSPKYISHNGSTVAKLSSSFLSLSLPKRPVRIGAAKLKRTSNVRGTKVTCWFRFGNKDAEGAGIYGSQSRDDFDRDDVEQVSSLLLSFIIGIFFSIELMFWDVGFLWNRMVC